MKIAIFSNGTINNYSYIKNYGEFDIVICCDGGLKHASKIDVFPNFIIGDFDSVNPSLLSSYEKQGSEVIRFNQEKNETDTELAMLMAIKKKPDEIFMFGSTGTRFDHTLANVHVLVHALNAGVKASIIDENNEIMLVNDEITISGKVGDYVSLIPFINNIDGITTSGLKYKLNNEPLFMGTPRGISNELTEEKATIKIKHGVLAVIKSRD